MWCSCWHSQHALQKWLEDHKELIELAFGSKLGKVIQCRLLAFISPRESPKQVVVLLTLLPNRHVDSSNVLQTGSFTQLVCAGEESGSAALQKLPTATAFFDGDAKLATLRIRGSTVTVRDSQHPAYQQMLHKACFLFSISS